MHPTGGGHGSCPSFAGSTAKIARSCLRVSASSGYSCDMGSTSASASASAFFAAAEASVARSVNGLRVAEAVAIRWLIVERIYGWSEGDRHHPIGVELVVVVFADGVVLSHSALPSPATLPSLRRLVYCCPLLLPTVVVWSAAGSSRRVVRVRIWGVVYEIPQCEAPDRGT